jgi:hypothetical protein
MASVLQQLFKCLSRLPSVGAGLVECYLSQHTLLGFAADLVQYAFNANLCHGES